MNLIEEMSPGSTNDGTVEITHKTIGPARPSRIRVASHIKVGTFLLLYLAKYIVRTKKIDPLADLGS